MNTDVLDDILGIVPEGELPVEDDPSNDDTSLMVPDEEQTALTVQSVPVDECLETDFAFARDKMRDLIKKGQEAVDSAIMLAQSGDSPRAYEVVGGMITAIIQANKELIAIHKARKDTREHIL